MEEKLRNILTLSEDEITKLKNGRVNSTRKFLDRPSYHLRNILRVSIAVVEEMKSNLAAQLAKEQTVEMVSGLKFLEDLARRETYATGIEQFDELFAGGRIVSGDIIEIFGLPESGKTMLLNTIMINILESSTEQDKILFIDTKNDFQAMRLKAMMVERGISLIKQRAILESISVEDVTTLEELIATLQNISTNRILFKKLKIIIIDSIAVPFYLYIGNMNYCLDRMTEVVQLLKTLSMHTFTVSS